MKWSKSRSWLRATAALVGLGLLAMFMTACSAEKADSGEEGGDNAEPITIGFAIAKSGWLNAFDMPMYEGAKKAIEEINAAGGVLGRQLEAIDTDAKSDATVAGPAAIDLIDQGADFLVTMCDYDLGGPSARAAGERDVLAFSCAASPLYNIASDLSYTTSSPTPAQGAAIAQFAMDQGWESAYVLADTSIDFTKSFCEAFEERYTAMGGKVAGKDTFQGGDQAVTGQVTRMRTSKKKFDVVMLCGIPPTGATAVKEIRGSGMDVPIMGPSAFAGPGWIEAVPNVSDVYGIATTSLWGDDPNPEVNEFYDGFAERPTNDYPVNGYTAVQAIARAIEKAESTETADVAAALNSFVDEPLLSGQTTYTEACRLPSNRDTRIVQIENGKGKFVQTATGEDVPWPDGIDC